MTPLTNGNTPSHPALREAAKRLQQAVRRNDLDAADAVVGEVAGFESASDGLDDSARCEFLRLAAVVHLRRQRWREAADALQQRGADDPAARTQLNLARNLDAMRRHRPRLYRILMEHPSDSECQLTTLSGGEQTIIQTIPGRPPKMLTPGGDAQAATTALLDALREPLELGRCLALIGVGDGRLLSHLAAAPPALTLGQEQCIHIIEPHPDVLLHAMMLHDYSGPRGPIVLGRFQWWVGRDWTHDFARSLEEDAQLPAPERSVPLSIDGRAIETKVRGVIESVEAAGVTLIERVRRNYETHSGDPHAPSRAWGPRPRLAGGNETDGSASSRRPRVLLLTTRFSTVLQYSTRDLAEAFAALGWEPRIVIERTPWNRTSPIHVLRMLVDFEPDLVVQIDHLRHEHGGIFPPRLPFVCWIQDDLPHLMRPEAGRSIGRHDFVLTTWGAVYVNDYDYPARQCIYMPKLTRLTTEQPISSTPSTPSTPHHAPSIPDLIYVSNASAQPDDLIDGVINDFGGQPELAAIVRATAERIKRIYADGGTIFSNGEVRRLLDEEAQRLDLTFGDQRQADPLTVRLFAAVNNALYRHQALDWALAAAQRLRLSIGLYGAGWENHPRFAPHARGPVQYGPDLETLTRRAAINLQIVPYMYLHQRWLDGVAAGGFFLIRAHPMDTLAADMAQFIRKNLDDSIRTLDEARHLVSDAARAELEALLQRRAALDEHRGSDPIAMYRLHQAEGRGFIYEPAPGLDEVSFADAPRIDELMERFAHDPAARAAVVAGQRAFVARHFSYEAGLRRALEKIVDLLRSEDDSRAAKRADGSTGRRHGPARREVRACA